MSEKKCISVFNSKAALPHNMPTINAKNITNVRSLMCRSRHITKRSNCSLKRSLIDEMYDMNLDSFAGKHCVKCIE